jgi:hypothetical protein
MELRAHVMVFRLDLLLRAANRRRRRQLAAELSAYVSHADLNDLHAILDTYPDGQTQEIRQILQGQQALRCLREKGVSSGCSR